MAKTTPASISKQLLAALARIDRPGTFCTSGSLPAVLPGLEVDGLGAIGLPLTASQAEELKPHCEQAPYGKGAETLVDTKIRRVWRLAPERFSLTNPAWTACLAEAVAKVQAELGLERRKLEAHLYDLLLYEKGGFFLPHRDGEKLDRMVATLVIVLPSAHEGGELIVRHEGQEQTIDFAGPAARFQTRYAAFYADCEHEVKPLHAGFRLCLIYNLTLAKSKKALRAPRSQDHILAVADILRDWSQAAGGPQKLAVTLAHQYTQDGLAWDALKGVDRARADILAQAARQAGCQAHLALLTLWESGSAEEDYSGYSSRRWGRHRRWSDDEEDEEEDAGQHTMGEIYDTSLTAEHWSGPAGERPAFGTIPVEREEIVPPESLTDVEPEEDYEGYTGNEGMTLERWYRHAAVVIWPDARHFDVLCAAGSRQAVPELARMVSAWRKAKGAEAATQQQRCREFAKRILARWPENPMRGWREKDEDEDAFDPLPSLVRLGDPDLIRQYFRDVLVKDATREPAKAMAKAVENHGWATFRAELVTVFDATNGETIERNVRLLERLCVARLRRVTKSEAAAADETCRLLAQSTVAALDGIDTEPAPVEWRMARIERATLLARLTRALLATGLEDLLSQVVAHALGLPKRYSLHGVQLPALAKLGPWLIENLQVHSPALSQWIVACERDLESLTAAVPQPPADFTRDANVACKCRECAELNRFLADPQEREHSFQLRQDRRTHLEQNIRSSKSDLDCTTNTRPRPQILICTKNTASHERRLKQYHENLEHLSAMQTLQENLPR